jgi:tetratricopeptide (TPR) repeat protein
MKILRELDIKKNSLLVPLITLILIFLSVTTQMAIDNRTEISKAKYIFLPDVDTVKRFSLGFDALVSDITWIRCVQYAGEKHYTANGLDWMYRSLDLVTTLDSKFETAYLFGGIILASDRNFVDESISILKKGMKNLPDRWRFPFYIGFNYFFYLQQFDLASDYIMKASKVPGSPSYLPLLASRLLAEANKPDTALAFLEKMYNQTEDPVLREKIGDRMKRVIVERDLNALQISVQEYSKIKGKNPETLGDVVRLGLVGGIPKEPFGGYYYLDRDTGNVQSSIVKERLRLYKKR